MSIHLQAVLAVLLLLALAIPLLGVRLAARHFG
jgi:hypothetical protein